MTMFVGLVVTLILFTVDETDELHRHATGYTKHAASQATPDAVCLCSAQWKQTASTSVSNTNWPLVHYKMRDIVNHLSLALLT